MASQPQIPLRSRLLTAVSGLGLVLLLWIIVAGGLISWGQWHDRFGDGILFAADTAMLVIGPLVGSMLVYCLLRLGLRRQPAGRWWPTFAAALLTSTLTLWVGPALLTASPSYLGTSPLYWPVDWSLAWFSYTTPAVFGVCFGLSNLLGAVLGYVGSVMQSRACLAHCLS